MIPLKQALRSSVGKKLVMSLSGLGLVVFVIIHLLGNLSLYKSDGATFNLYAHTLEGYGPLLTIAELGLLGMFLVHIFWAFGLKRGHWNARPRGYQRGARSKGGASLSNIASRNMIVSGGLLLAFLALHVWQFRFGPDESAGYVASAKGMEVRDLYRLVHETFGNPLFAAIYVGAMGMLGFHLRHGFWSAFQSLGAMNERLTKPVHAAGALIAVVLAAGFLFIPVWIYFDIPRVLQ